MFNIYRKKGASKHEWDLKIKGVTVGTAVAVYSTPTQRTWNAKVSVPVQGGSSVEASVDGVRSVATAVKQIEAILATKTSPSLVDVVKPQKKAVEGDKWRVTDGNIEHTAATREAARKLKDELGLGNDFRVEAIA